jgi:signal transduction histidine kinase
LKLLALFLRHPRRLLRRSVIFECVWGFAPMGELKMIDAVERNPVNRGPLVERIAERARLVSSGQHIVLVAREPLQVTGDADRLYQAIWNLVENALRYTPTTGRVRLSLRQDGGLAADRVADVGPGITRAQPRQSRSSASGSPRR